MLQFNDTLRNNRANQIESSVGTSPQLKLFSGPLPANCAAADAGIMLCNIQLPSDWLSNAAAGVKSKVGTWSANADVAAGAGTMAGHWRIKQSTTTWLQGNITATGGGGAMTIDSLNIISGQPVNVTAFTTTEGNA